MATATLENETAADDFAGDSAPIEQNDQSAIQDSQESQPALDQPVDQSDEYDLGDSLEPPEQQGESDPPAETAAQQPVTEPAVSGVVDDGESFPPELLRLTNLDAARAKAAFGTPEALERAWLNQVMNAGREADYIRQQQALQQRQPAPPSRVPQQPAPTQQELAEYLRLKLELPEAFADVEDNKLLFDALGNQVSQFYGPKLQYLEAELIQNRQLLQHFAYKEQAEQVARHDEEFDRFISDLPEEWHELFGKDRPEVGTPQHQARAQLFHQKSMIENGTRQLGQDVPLRRALELGLRTAFPNQHDTIIKKSVTTQRRNGQTRLARPNSRKGLPASPDEQAIQNMRDRIKGYGPALEQSVGATEADFI